MNPAYKFEVMFRGQQVIVEYYLDRSGEIDVAIISDETPNFIHPNYEEFNHYLDRFHTEVYELAKKHLRKVKQAQRE